jgi:hypothetical protein
MCAVERRDHPAGDRPTRQLSLQPLAIGAVVEVTKRLKPLMERVTSVTPRARRLQRAVNRRSGPEKGQCGSRPDVLTGKAAIAGEVSETGVIPK